MPSCVYQPIYRSCVNCGYDMTHGEVRACKSPPSPDPIRVQALRESRELIKSNAVSTWKSGHQERSDALTELLVEFDWKFPEAKDA